MIGAYSRPHIRIDADALRTAVPGYWGVRHADGIPVTREKPAKPGEALTLYAVGLGLPSDSRTASPPQEELVSARIVPGKGGLQRRRGRTMSW